MSHTVIPFSDIPFGLDPLRSGRRRSTATGRTSPNRAARRQRRYRPELVPAPDPEMELVSRNIDRAGLHLVHVGESCDCGECSAGSAPRSEQFGYTVGLTGHEHPELLVRGLGARETAELLGRWGGTVLAGDEFSEGHLLCEGPGGASWKLVAVPRARRELVWATRFYGRDRIGPRSALELIPTQRPCRCSGCG